MANPLVSVIIPTRNSAATLSACLGSIKNQTYPNIELIVVDRDSTDRTRQIAKQYTPNVYRHGPERSAQRNLGATRSTGQYLLFIDADMELEPTVIEACVQALKQKPQPVAVTIPEISFGQGFWAQCKALERSYYNGVDWVECPRFMSATIFRKAGRYNEQIAGGEDWDLTVRLRKLESFTRIKPIIHHNEGRVSLRDLMAKRYRLYGEGWNREGQANHFADGPRLLVLYLSRPLTTLRHPIRWSGMMIMRTVELSARVIGLNAARSQR